MTPWNSFRFIDVGRQKYETIIKYEVRAQAAFHGHGTARRREPFKYPPQDSRSASTLSTPRANRPRRSRTGNSQHGRRPLRVERTVEEVDQVPMLLTPYSKPASLANQGWVDDMVNEWFNNQFAKVWPPLNLEMKLGFAPSYVVNWLRLSAMTDSVVFCIQALAAAFCTLPKGEIAFKKFYWLSSKTIAELNMALSDPTRMLSSLTIFAVLQLGTYEAYGCSIDVARDVHVQGLRRMLALKGGEEKFAAELPPFIRILSRWYSQSLAEICGVEPILCPLGVESGDVRGSTLDMVNGGMGGDLLDDYVATGGRNDVSLEDLEQVCSEKLQVVTSPG